jgi:hypothetical protein
MRPELLSSISKKLFPQALQRSRSVYGSQDFDLETLAKKKGEGFARRVTGKALFYSVPVHWEISRARNFF